MYFVVHCMDRENAGELRQATRPAHLEYMSEIGDRVALAGPYLDAEGNSIGSMLVVRADTAEDVRRLMDGDPYSKAGLFETVTILPWRWVINAPQT